MEKFADIVYQRPDFAAFKAALTAHIERVRAAAAWPELREAWLAHTEDKRALFTMQTVASIRNTVDTTDPFYEAEMRVFHSEMPVINLMERQAEAALLASPFVDDFAAEFGEIPVKTMRASQRFADERLVPLQIREAELQQRYSKASATASTEFEGRTVNFYGLLKEMQSTDHAHRSAAFRAWADLYQRIAPELDAIYDEMIALRAEMADTLGFASYTEMAYQQRRRFDYTAEDARRFREQVKAVVTPACAALYEKQRARIGVDALNWYDEGLIFPEGNAMPLGTKDEQVARALDMYRELSSETGEFFAFMTEHELFDLETKPGKRPGGYCTSLPAFHAPFIFSNFNGTAADIEVLTHEAGHAFENYTASRLMPLMEQTHSTSEINEIHSMAMEHFTYPWMDKFFGENTDKFLYSHLWGALNVIPYMCCVDEFQHHVYDEKLDAAGRYACWAKLEKEYMPWRSYEDHDFLTAGGFWMQKQHIFLYPFYYIEYALAQMCAFQFYLHMKQDHAAAWADYLRLCRAGGSLGYFDLLKLAGLRNPFEAGTVEDALSAVLSSLDELDGKLNK